MKSVMKELLTTGEAASLCKVGPRMVAKWFDSGELQGYRLPGPEGERRIPRENLFQFCEENGIPLGEGKRFTTGEVASITKVSTKTVNKRFDSGELQGYRLPGPGRYRRFPRENVVRFLTDRGRPVDVSLRKFVLWGAGPIIQGTREKLEGIVGETGEVQVVEDAFSAGLEMQSGDYLVFEEANCDNPKQIATSLEQNGKSGWLILNKMSCPHLRQDVGETGIQVSSFDAPAMIVSEIKRQLEKQDGNDAKIRKAA